MLSCQLYVLFKKNIYIFPVYQSFVGSSVHQQAEVLYGINRILAAALQNKREISLFYFVSYFSLSLN